MPGTDKALPENSQPNLNKKLDRAVEETFPSSDPVSVSITKGGAIDYDHDDDEAEDPSIVRSNLGQQDRSESLLDQAKEKLSDVGSTVSEAAHEAYTEGSRYVREAVGHHPEMERYYRQGTEAVRQQASDNPLLTLLVGLGLGYALAWMIHGTASGGARGVPDYARTRAGLRSPQRGLSLARDEVEVVDDGAASGPRPMRTVAGLTSEAEEAGPSSSNLAPGTSSG